MKQRCMQGVTFQNEWPYAHHLVTLRLNEAINDDLNMLSRWSLCSKWSPLIRMMDLGRPLIYNIHFVDEIFTPKKKHFLWYVQEEMPKSGISF
jgi:hypothetical protein